MGLCVTFDGIRSTSHYLAAGSVSGMFGVVAVISGWRRQGVPSRLGCPASTPLSFTNTATPRAHRRESRSSPGATSTCLKRVLTKTGRLVSIPENPSSQQDKVDSHG